MDNFLRNLDATNVIRDNLPKIIEVFIEFYGEEYRDLVTEKLNNTIILGYYDSETLFSLICDEKQKMFNEIIADIFDELGIEKTKENQEKYFVSSINFDYENIIPIFKLINYIEI